MLYSYAMRLLRTYNEALTDIQQVRQLPGTYEDRKMRRRPHGAANPESDDGSGLDG